MADKEKKPIDYTALSKSVRDQDVLATQYGAQQGSSRAVQAKTASYNKAWAEYSAANPNAKKDNFRDIYSTKVANEEEITPWQERARADLLAASELASEDSTKFREEQKQNFAGLDQRSKSRRGAKALESIKEFSKGGLPSDIKKLLKYKGRNTDQYSDKEFGAIQKYLETRSGTGYSDAANETLQNLYKQSPTKRTSPFKQVRSLNINQGPNYADLSDRIGSSVQGAINEQRIARERSEEMDLSLIHI